MGLQRIEHPLQGHVHALGLFAVDVRVELRHTGAKILVETRRDRASRALGDDIVGDLLQKRQPRAAPILKLHLETAGGPETRDGRRTKRDRDAFGDFGEPLLGHRDQLGDGMLAVVPVFQGGDGEAVVGSLDRVQQRVAADSERISDPGHVEHNLVHPCHHFARSFERCAGRELGIDVEVAFVLARNETGGQHSES